jgi:2-C-methyl-D-erythritol 2,4-cyclodiphosphate synthase
VVAVKLPRVGIGYDVHRFSDDPARPFVLGGVTFEGQPGLVGHSDADAAAHAIADALLGAAGLGDIGQHFPDTDKEWKDADSLVLLRAIALRVQAAGFEIGNVDCTVITEAPKLAPMRDEMEKNLSSAIDAPVTVKASRPEALGALGRGEGLACMAVALIVPVEVA